MTHAGVPGSQRESSHTAAPTRVATIVGWMRQGAGEVALTFRATWEHLLAVGYYAAALLSRRSAANAAYDARLSHGERLYRSGLGDEQLHRQIGELDERIERIKQGKGSTRQLRAERRGLLYGLSECGGKHERMQQADDAVTRTQQTAADRRQRLRPASPGQALRIGVGYTACALVLLLLAGTLAVMGSVGAARHDSTHLAATAGLGSDPHRSIADGSDRGGSAPGQTRPDKTANAVPEELRKLEAFLDNREAELQAKLNETATDPSQPGGRTQPPTEAEMRQAFQDRIEATNAQLAAKARIAKNRTYDRNNLQSMIEAFQGAIVGDGRVKLVEFKKIGATKALNSSGYIGEFAARLTVEGDGTFARQNRPMFQRYSGNIQRGLFYNVDGRWIFDPLD